MLRVNLLPVKAKRKHGTAKNELMAVAALLVLVLVGVFVWYTMADSQIDDMQTQIDTVKTEIAQLKKDVVRVDDFKKKAQTLERKIGVIDTLKKKRTGPAKMLDDLATILTDEKKVWLTRIDEKGGVLTLEGGAMEHENISDFQLALERRSKFFTNIKLGFVTAATKDGVSYLLWKITCNTNYAAG